MARITIQPAKDFVTEEAAFLYGMTHRSVYKQQQWDTVPFALFPRNRQETSTTVWRIAIDHTSTCPKYVRINGTIR